MLRSVSEWKERLQMGETRVIFMKLYGNRMYTAIDRYTALLNRFAVTFGADRKVAIFSAPGRTEIGGNHTDHQRGRVLAAAVSVDCIAVAAPNGTNAITLSSLGYDPIRISLDTLEPIKAEENTSAALLRGMAYAMGQYGCDVGGFDAVIESDVPGGSGLSSSAAFSVLLGNIMAGLFADFPVDPVRIAQAAKLSENCFFGKPSGLMDQLASSLGGFVAIDFADEAEPKVEKLSVDPDALGLAVCLIATGGSHADLTDEYAAVPNDMRAVAACFQKSVLSEVDREEFYRRLPALRDRVGDLALLRAMHFFEETDRAGAQADALKAGDTERFLQLVRESGRSSFELLQNVCPTDRKERAVALAIGIAERFLSIHAADDTWAVRVHGGGFAGAIQAFVPISVADAFAAHMEAVFGSGSCYRVNIRPVGGVML